MAKKSENNKPIFDNDPNDIPPKTPINGGEPSDFDLNNFNKLSHVNPKKQKKQSKSEASKKVIKKSNSTKSSSISNNANNYSNQKSQISTRPRRNFNYKNNRNNSKYYKFKYNNNQKNSKYPRKSQFYKNRYLHKYGTNMNNNNNNNNQYLSSKQKETKRIESYRKNKLHKLFAPPKISKTDIIKMTPQHIKQMEDKYNKYLYNQSNKLAPDVKSQKYNDGKNVAKQILRGDVTPTNINPVQLSSFKTYRSWQRMQQKVAELSKKFSQNINKIKSENLKQEHTHKPLRRTQHLHMKPISHQEIRNAQQRTLNQIREFHRQIERNSPLHNFYKRLMNNHAIKSQRLNEIKRQYDAKQQLLSNSYLNNDLYTGHNHYIYNAESFKNAHKNEKLRYQIKKAHPNITTENQLKSFCQHQFYQRYPELKNLKRLKNTTNLNKAIQERHQLFMTSEYSLPIDQGMTNLNLAYNYKQINGLKESVNSANQSQGITGNENQSTKASGFNRFLTFAQQGAKRIIRHISTSPAFTKLAKKIGIRTKYQDVNKNSINKSQNKRHVWSWGQEQDEERTARKIYGNKTALALRHVYNAKQQGKPYQSIIGNNPNVAIFDKAYRKYLSKSQVTITTNHNNESNYADEKPKPTLQHSKDIKAIKELRKINKKNKTRIKSKPTKTQHQPYSRMQRLHGNDIER